MVVLTIYGHPIEIVMFFFAFLYSCLKVDKYPKSARLDAQYDDISIPPGIMAMIETRTAM